jgi:hypothetical protein
MKKFKLIISILIVFAIAGLAYFLGYYKGKQDDDVLPLRLNLDKELYVYKSAEDGDLKAVKSKLSFFIFGDYDFYESHYSNQPVSAAFSEKLEAAKGIASNSATNGNIMFFKK